MAISTRGAAGGRVPTQKVRQPPVAPPNGPEDLRDVLRRIHCAKGGSYLIFAAKLLALDVLRDANLLDSEVSVREILLEFEHLIAAASKKTHNGKSLASVDGATMVQDQPRSGGDE